MTRRLSRGTPYILTSTEITETLKHLPPRVEAAIATLMNVTVDEWRAQPDKLRAKQLVDFQNAGVFAATMSASERAIGDLEATAFPVVAPDHLGDLVSAVVDEIRKQGLIVVNPSTAQKGA